MSNINEISIQKINNESGDSEIALVSFQGNARDQIIKQLNDNLAITGSYVKSGGQSSSLTILSLLGSSGASLGVSGMLSGTLFMATANPATLMQLGSGVGSAVMGSAGIVAQAPFIPIAGAIMPVAAPLIAFQAMSSIAMMKEFDNLNRKINDIQMLVSRGITRQEADKIGNMLDLAQRIERLESQYSRSKRFSNDMLIQLALAENEVGPLFERYNYLFAAQEVSSSSSLEDLQFIKHDSYMAILVSMLDIRTQQLRLKATIQDDPGFLPEASKLFLNAIADHESTWERIGQIPKVMTAVAKQISRDINSKGAVKGTVDHFTGGTKKLSAKLEAFLSESDIFEELIGDKIPELTKATRLIAQDTASNTTNLLYWKDELGEHSFYTDDFTFQTN